MDIARPDQSKAKRKKRIIYGVVAGVILIAITVVLAKLKPAAPTVEVSLYYPDTVKRGEMLRQVRGLGTLVPDEIRWIAARTQGRVDKIILRPGAPVEPGSVILILTNPDVEQLALNADSQWKAAQADYENTKVTLQSQVLQAEATAAQAEADFKTSALNAKVTEQLFKDGLASEMERQLRVVTADTQKMRYEIEQKKFAFTKSTIEPQLAVKQASVDQLKAQAKLRHDELDALTVRSSMTGVVSALQVEVGAQVNPGSNLARVADPRKLKAEIRVAETQAKDVTIGLPAVVDTRNGEVKGHVTRVDAAVQNGTVTVDVTIDDPLPRGARPDLSVDGTIELERLKDVLFVGRPAFGQENSTVGIFKIDPDGSYANRVQVKLGRSSVNYIEIVSGLQAGDRVFLSDMSQWDANDRLKLK